MNVQKGNPTSHKSGHEIQKKKKKFCLFKWSKNVSNLSTSLYYYYIITNLVQT